MAISRKERDALVEQYARGPKRVRGALAKVTKAALKWRPGEGKWSVHEVIVHCADSETNAAMLEKKQPNNPLTWNVKGIIYISKRDVKNARTNFAKSVELKPDYLPAVLNLAKLDIYEKNTQAARARFDTIIAAQPKNEGAILGLAEVLAQSGAPAKEVVATLERAIAASTGSVYARVALVNYHLRNRDGKAAIDAAQAAVALSPNDPRLYELLGNAQLSSGETNQAITTFNKLVSMRPDAPEPLVRLAGAHFAARDYAASIAALRKALAMNPDLVEVRRQIGVILAASGKMDEAFARAVNRCLMELGVRPRMAGMPGRYTSRCPQ